MRHRPTLLGLSVIIVMLLSSGCAPVKPYVLADYQRDPEFNRLELLVTGLVLGGVTVSAFSATVEERDALTAQLEDVLTQFSLYRINTPVKLSERVGKERYDQIMDYFKANQALRAEDFAELRSLYTPARYILFFNLDNEQQRQQTLHNPGVIEYHSMRIMDGRLYIFNLDTGKTTLYTRIGVRDFKSNNVQQVSGGASFSILFGNVIAQVALGGYPEPPTRQQTLYKLFLGVADQVPNQ